MKKANKGEWSELYVFLKLLAETEDRTATFYSASALYHEGSEEVFLGTTSGIITTAPQTEIEQGIPVSSVFIPEGGEKVFSAMSPEEKNKVSHRGKASRKMKTFLMNL